LRQRLVEPFVFAGFHELGDVYFFQVAELDVEVCGVGGSLHGVFFYEIFLVILFIDTKFSTKKNVLKHFVARYCK